MATNKGIEEGLKALRGKLPERGYAVLIHQQITDGGKNNFSIAKIHNLFAGKSVNRTDTLAIIKAAKKVVKTLEKEEADALNMLQC